MQKQVEREIAENANSQEFAEEPEVVESQVAEPSFMED